VALFEHERAELHSRRLCDRPAANVKSDPHRGIRCLVRKLGCSDGQDWHFEGGCGLAEGGVRLLAVQRGQCRDIGPVAACLRKACVDQLQNVTGLSTRTQADAGDKAGRCDTRHRV
jgi:hypothetical protein